ncbi:MAG: hydroxymethylbilane synthase [Micavibrio sp.]|nr:hydroxymethylbilane synthase [Micavibrio sp.]
MSQKVKIGTRGSKMALIQATDVEARLRKINPDLDTEIVIIKTSGDWKPGQGEQKLSEAQGGKGLFAKEIEQALMDKRIDIGVHSVKDMPSFLPDGLVMEHYLEREDCRDAFVSLKYHSVHDLPPNALVGTSSVRRQAFLLLKRPDIQIVPFRGNVPTRIEKMKAGQVDATILSYAGMKRIEVEDMAGALFEPHEMVPACGQGVVGIEYRQDDTKLKALLDQLNDRETSICVSAERAALQVLDGTCHAPIGVNATYENGRLFINLIVARHDGTEFWQAKESGRCNNESEAIRIGQDVANIVKKDADPAVLKV